MAGEWIRGKAEGLVGVFGGEWSPVGDGVLQGRCPGQHLHTGGKGAATDARIHLGFGAGGEKPGCYCFHHGCRGLLEGLNREFRDRIFDRAELRSGDAGGAGEGRRAPRNDGVVMFPPRERESWIPEFDIAKLRQVVHAVPEVSREWFMERSPVDVRGVGPEEYLSHVFAPGERAMVFTVYKGPGDFLWEVGRGGFRLAKKRGVRAVPSRLPVDGGQDGVWYLSNPVDGMWYPNPRRNGEYSRRSMESVTGWRHLLLECDEEKTCKAKAVALRAAYEAFMCDDENWQAALEVVRRPKWAAEVARVPQAMWDVAEVCEREAQEVPGLWMRFLAMCPLELVAIYSSGGYSLHGLWRVNMETKGDFDTLLRNEAKRKLPVLGADPAAMTPVRLTRLPGCMRKGRMQELIFLNPGADGGRIVDLPRVRRV